MWSETSHLILGAIVGVDQRSHMITPTGLVLILEGAQHVKQGKIKLFHWIPPRVVWCCPNLLDSCHLTVFPDCVGLKIWTWSPCNFSSMLKCTIKFSHRHFAIVRAFWLGVRMAITNLVKWSVITNMSLVPLLSASKDKKSIQRCLVVLILTKEAVFFRLCLRPHIPATCFHFLF